MKQAQSVFTMYPPVLLNANENPACLSDLVSGYSVSKRTEKESKRIRDLGNESFMDLIYLT